MKYVLMLALGTGGRTCLHCFGGAGKNERTI
jgi:hypothetical protein